MWVWGPGVRERTLVKARRTRASDSQWHDYMYSEPSGGKPGRGVEGSSQAAAAGGTQVGDTYKIDAFWSWLSGRR